MRRITQFFILLITFIFFACQLEQKQSETMVNPDLQVRYPKTKQIDHVDRYHAKEVADPYRWLEDDRAPETEDWVERQNKVTFDYLEKIPFRQGLTDRLTELWNYEKYSAPFNRGAYTYFYKNDGLQNQSVLYRQKKDDDPEIFLDPNQFSEDGTTSLAGISFTDDGSKAAYLISEGGSDWRKIIVLDAETKKVVEDTIKDVKFSGVAWKGNEGFFYSSYDKPEQGSVLSGKTQYHKLFYHQLGTPQSDDQLIFGGQEKPRRYIFANGTEDGRWLIIAAAESTHGNELYLKDLNVKNAPIVPVVDNFLNDHYVVHSEGEEIFVYTKLNAPNGRLIKVGASQPRPENWIDVIAERKRTAIR